MFGVGEKQARGGAASLDLTNNRQTILPVVLEKGMRAKPLVARSCRLLVLLQDITEIG